MQKFTQLALRPHLLLYLLAALIFLYSLNGVNEAHAATTSSAGLVGAQMMSQNLFGSQPASMAPALSMPAIPQIANIYSSCSTISTPIQNVSAQIAAQSAMSSGSGLLGMAGMSLSSCPMVIDVSISTSCPGGSSVPDISSSNLTCDNYSPNSAAQMEMTLSQAACGLQCQQAKTQAIQAQLQCLSTQGQALSQKINTMSQQFNNNIHQMQNTMLSIKNTILDNSAQMADASGKLNGSDTNPNGLKDLQTSLTNMVGQMPSDIANLQQAQYSHNQAVTNYQASTQIQQSALAMTCFQAPYYNYRCTPNGPPVSPSDYVTCLYQQQQMTGANGTLNKTSFQTSQAGSAQQSLQSLLSQIVNSVPSNPNVPSSSTDTEASTAFANQNLMTIPQVISAYSGLLSNFQIKNTNAGQIVSQALQYCNSLAANQVSREENLPSSALGTQAQALQAQQLQINQSVEENLAKYRQEYTTVMAGLTGQNMALNTSACTNGGNMSTNQVAAAQVGCMQNIYTTLNGVLQGNTSGSQIQMQVKGTIPANYQTINCSGLNGCIQALSNTVRNLTARAGSLEQEKSQYALSAMNQTQSFLTTLSTGGGTGEGLSAQSQALTQNMNAINAAMGSLGIQPGKVPTVAGEELQKDEDGLPVAPKSMLALVAGQVQPPLLDTSSAEMGDLIGEAAQKGTDINSELQSIQMQISTLSGLGASCASQANQQSMMDLSQNSTGLGKYSCHDSEYCKGDNLMALQMATSQITQQGGPVTQTANLQTGIATVCAQPDAAMQEKLNTREASGAVDPAACEAYFSSILDAQKNVQMNNARYGVNPAGAGVLR